MELLASDDSGAVVLYECMECGFQSEENVENVLEEPLDDEDPPLAPDPDEDDEPFPENGDDAYLDTEDDDVFDGEQEERS
jgi:hypothetical protein